MVVAPLPLVLLTVPVCGEKKFPPSARQTLPLARSTFAAERCAHLGGRSWHWAAGEDFRSACCYSGRPNAPGAPRSSAEPTSVCFLYAVTEVSRQINNCCVFVVLKFFQQRFDILHIICNNESLLQDRGWPAGGNAASAGAAR